MPEPISYGEWVDTRFNMLGTIATQYPSGGAPFWAYEPPGLTGGTKAGGTQGQILSPRLARSPLLTPEWLPQFSPEQVAGKKLKKKKVRTPSGQQWGKTPWSVREGLRGYTEWAGFRPYRDILEHMAMMQSKTPVGAGRERWKPIRQV